MEPKIEVEEVAKKNLCETCRFGGKKRQPKGRYCFKLNLIVKDTKFCPDYKVKK